MSHFVAIKTSVTDINALKKACEELGLRFQEKGTARGYASHTLKGDYVIGLKGPYDIAVHKTQIEARKKGLNCRRQLLGDGSVKIMIGGL